MFVVGETSTAMATEQLSKEALLVLLEERGTIDSSQICHEKKWDHQVFIGVMNSLISREMAVAESTAVQIWVPSNPDGENVLEKSSPEAQVFNALCTPMTKKELEVSSLSLSL